MRDEIKIAEDIIQETHYQIITVHLDTTAYEAVNTMCSNKIGAILADGCRQNGRYQTVLFVERR